MEKIKQQLQAELKASLLTSARGAHYHHLAGRRDALVFVLRLLATEVDD